MFFFLFAFFIRDPTSIIILLAFVEAAATRMLSAIIFCGHFELDLYSYFILKRTSI